MFFFWLQSSGWWTDLGNMIIFVCFALALACGVVLFRKSKMIYFFAGWLGVVAAPIFIALLSEQVFGREAILAVRPPRQEDGFQYMWLGLALLEPFFIWIPVAGVVLNRMYGEASPAK